MQSPSFARFYSAAAIICFAIASPTSLRAEKLAPGPGRFEVTHNGVALPVWYYLPEGDVTDAPVLVVMHGVKRDADRYLKEWLPHAEKHGSILLVPEFSKAQFPSAERYNLGNMFDEAGKPLPRDQWSFSFIEPVFDAMQAATGNRAQRYSIYGHSAGGQFVHRFVYFMPEARVAKAVAANPGWWTLPDFEMPFPYGLKNTSLDEAALKKVLAKPLIVLLGTKDTDPNHVNLTRTPEAMKQGPHRFARGQNAFAAAQRRAKELNTPLGWQFSTAPGIDHSNLGMAPFAVRHLLPPPAITGRDPQRVRILFGGDTSAGESYQDQFAAQGLPNVLIEKGYDHGMVQLDKLMAAADYRVINLETPLTARRDSPYTSKDYLHYSDPVKVPALFTKFGPVSFSLANNHTLDHGVPGLDDTRAALVAAGIDYFGAGENLADAARPLVQEFRLGDKSVTLALFGTFEYRRDYDEDYEFYARGDRPGAAPIDVEAVKRAVHELRRTKPDAVVVYFVHWGGNYKWKNEEQTKHARTLRAAGVDLVIGHGAHMLQEVEHDGRGWIFYSIGNFLFNSGGRYAAYQAPPYGLPLVVELSRQDGKPKTTVRAYPIVSDNSLTAYQPRFVTADELTKIEALLAEKSDWSDDAKSLVNRGADECGPYLEFRLSPRR